MSSVPLPHVLVVDDDPSVRQLVDDYLGSNDFRVTGVESGTQLLTTLRAQVIDLVLLDLRLRAEDGMQLLRTLRAESQIPIIILTGKSEEADRVMGLELGADDYLTKPFSPRELLARIRTVLRRSSAATPAQSREGELRAFRFAEFELNLRTRRLATRNGRRIELTNGEFNLLAALLASAQRVLTRDQLIEASRVY